MSDPLVIATRGSRLALWQAEHVAGLLRQALGLEARITPIRSAGDDLPGTMAAAEAVAAAGAGLFTDAVERAVAEGRADLAVHSLKDLPTCSSEGLIVAAIPARGPAGDVLVSREGHALADLPAGAVVLSGSLRRRALVLEARPDVQVAPIRGNVPTRLSKLDAGAGDAIVLAEAGLVRLGLAERIAQRLDPEHFAPACGQGALAVQARSDRPELLAALAGIDDAPTRAAVTAERAFLAAVGAGCAAPVGGYAHPDGDDLHMLALVAEIDGTAVIRRRGTAPATEAESLGRRLAEEILAAGGRAIVDDLLGRTPPGHGKDTR